MRLLNFFAGVVKPQSFFAPACGRSLAMGFLLPSLVVFGPLAIVT